MDQLEQRALAGAGMTGDEQHFAGGDFETHVGQRVVTAGIAFADVVEAQDGHSMRNAAGMPASIGGRRADG